MEYPACIENRGAVLLALARGAIHRALGVAGPAPPPDAPWLHEPGASFVTLTRHGELRGCVGSAIASRPLREDVIANALGAAFRDPRFSPLTRDELDAVRVEVSLLSPPEPLAAADEAEALARLRPGVDGVILAYGPYRATFLPQVWEKLPEPRRFLAHLKMKAGLPADFWAPGVRLARYTAEKWREPEQRMAS